ncbi:MAG: hypothetical protein IPN59_07670 [Holophaga sp.]|nr:hypothetical protein [Holophaga sp.]
MSRPLLLILDGQSLKSAGVGEALAKDGWDVAYTSCAEAPAFVGGTETSLILLDPFLSGEAALHAVQSMRSQDHDVPVVVFKGADNAASAGKGFHIPIPDVRGT